MVNLRYHLVSLTAVFLALGVGVLVGSAVVDQGTVSFLEDRLAAVERDVDRTQSENARLRRQLDALREEQDLLAEQATTRVLPGLLPDARVQLVATRGTDQALVDQLRDDLVAAGADVPFTVWLTSRLDLESGDDAVDLAQALGLPPELAERPSALQVAARTGVAAALWPPLGPVAIEDPESGQGEPPAAGPADPSADPPTQEGAPAPVAGEEALAEARAALEALAEAGFLEVRPTPGTAGDADPFAGLEATAAVVLVAGPGSEVDADTVLPLLGAWAGADSLPAVVAVTTVGDDRRVEEGSVVHQIRTETALADQISTVDDVGRFAGRLATVLVIADAPLRAEPGHYGVGEGAQRLLPAPPQ